MHYATVYKRPNATVFGRLIDLAHELDQTYVSFPKRRSKSIKLLNDKYPPDIESSFWGRGYVVEGWSQRKYLILLRSTIALIYAV